MGLKASQQTAVRCNARRCWRPCSVPMKILIFAAGVVTLSTPVFIGFASAPELNGQSQTTGRLAFEVASIKPNNAGGSASRREVQQSMMLRYLLGGRFSARGVPIPILIFEAYSVWPGRGHRIQLKPEFEKSMDRKMESERYDIEAVAAKGAIPANTPIKVQREKTRLMLQTLLTDRFKVRISHETKEVPVYAIVVGSNGPKLRKSAMGEAKCAETSADKPENISLFSTLAPGFCHYFIGGEGRGLHGQAITMSDLARAFELFSDRPIVDQTGLKGLYKIDIPAMAQPQSASPPPLGTEPALEGRALLDPAPPTLADAVRDLGLKLESTKAPVEMLEVEHFERPTKN